MDGRRRLARIRRAVADPAALERLGCLRSNRRLWPLADAAARVPDELVGLGSAGPEPGAEVPCPDIHFLGFGDSDKPRDHEYSIGEQADVTEALWRRLGIEETGLVGHDYGATVAQELLARAEEGTLDARLNGVVLLNAGLYVELARPLLIQRLLAAPLVGRILAHLVTERAFSRSLSSVFSDSHQPTAADLHQQWQLVRRR